MNVNINFKTINKHEKSYRKAIDLYKAAFIRNEREYLWFLNLRARKKQIFLKSINYNNKQIGIIFYRIYNNILFILYFAIEEEYKSKGYGTKVLSLLKEKYSNKKIILEIEEVNEKYLNNDLRERRLNFYLKNGFKLSNIMVNFSNDFYNIMFFNNDISVKEIKDFYIYYFGFFKLFFMPKIFRI